MASAIDQTDPKGLIREAYQIEGITDAECRSILLDWALSVPGDMRTALMALVQRYGAQDHPMTALLHEGLRDAPHRTRGRRRP